jgi:hypothetical protein
LTAGPLAWAIAPAPAIAPVLARVAAFRNPRRPRADCSVSRRSLPCLRDARALVRLIGRRTVRT